MDGGLEKSGREVLGARQVVHKFSRDIESRPGSFTGTGPASILCQVTEIPEHLLKRSRERRAAIGQGGDDGASEGAAPAPAATPATTEQAPAAAAASGPPARTGPPAPEAAPAPKPDPQYVVAAKQRRKVPWWAMATLGLMPIWGLMYVRALTEPPEVVEGPLGIGAEQYGSCAACHGAAGGGGVGYAFAGEEVLRTFPVIEDQLRYVYWGTGEYNLAGVEIYGNPDREGGPHLTNGLGVMPQQGSAAGGGLTDYEILGVVCHERYTLGGADPNGEEWGEEFERYCSEESPVFEALEAGEISLLDEEPHTFMGPDGVEFEMDIVGAPREGSAGES
jgi:mono/diheme cytochrome c family protein